MILNENKYRKFKVNSLNSIIESMSVSKLSSDIPKILYHATYKPLLKNIKLKGLGAGRRKWWDDSKKGVTYLAGDSEVAGSYAETAESDWLDEHEEWLDNIIILEIDTSKLNIDKLFIDENVQTDETNFDNLTFEYHDIIPFSAVSKVTNYN